MPKPTLLYASPFPPKRSGIAVYSRWMVEGLAEHFDVTLYTDDYGLEDGCLKRNFRALRHGKDSIPFDHFDHRMYHMGNNPWYHGYIYEACLRHPGWVVLHEYVLYYLVAGLYRDRPDFLNRLYRIGGAAAVARLKGMIRRNDDLLRFQNPERVPLNLELLSSPNKLIVHSEYVERLVKEACPQAQVFRGELVQFDDGPRTAVDRAAVLARAGIPADAIVVASLGFVAPTKLNHVACRAIKRLIADRRAPFYYLMIGEGDYIRPELDDRIRLTGYVTEEQFDEYLACADLVLNLRYPVMGETSAALLRAFSFDKPCIVTGAGWFSELPNQAVLKLDVTHPHLIEEQLYEALDIFLDHPLPFERMGAEAGRYVRSRHSVEVVARAYSQLLR